MDTGIQYNFEKDQNELYDYDLIVQDLFHQQSEIDIDVVLTQYVQEKNDSYRLEYYKNYFNVLIDSMNLRYKDTMFMFIT